MYSKDQGSRCKVPGIRTKSDDAARVDSYLVRLLWTGDSDLDQTLVLH